MNSWQSRIFASRIARKLSISISNLVSTSNLKIRGGLELSAFLRWVAKGCWVEREDFDRTTLHYTPQGVDPTSTTTNCHHNKTKQCIALDMTAMRAYQPGPGQARPSSRPFSQRHPDNGPVGYRSRSSNCLPRIRSQPTNRDVPSNAPSCPRNENSTVQNSSKARAYPNGRGQFPLVYEEDNRVQSASFQSSLSSTEERSRYLGQRTFQQLNTRRSSDHNSVDTTSFVGNQSYLHPYSYASQWSANKTSYSSGETVRYDISPSSQLGNQLRGYEGNQRRENTRTQLSRDAIRPGRRDLLPHPRHGSYQRINQATSSEPSLRPRVKKNGVPFSNEHAALSGRHHQSQSFQKSEDTETSCPPLPNQQASNTGLSIPNKPTPRAPHHHQPHRKGSEGKPPNPPSSQRAEYPSLIRPPFIAATSINQPKSERKQNEPPVPPNTPQDSKNTSPVPASISIRPNQLQQQQPTQPPPSTENEHEDDISTPSSASPGSQQQQRLHQQRGEYTPPPLSNKPIYHVPIRSQPYLRTSTSDASPLSHWSDLRKGDEIISTACPPWNKPHPTPASPPQLKEKTSSFTQSLFTSKLIPISQIEKNMLFVLDNIAYIVTHKRTACKDGNRGLGVAVVIRGVDEWDASITVFGGVEGWVGVEGSVLGVEGARDMSGQLRGDVGEGRESVVEVWDVV